jgi:hypothetical protein
MPRLGHPQDGLRNYNESHHDPPGHRMAAFLSGISIVCFAASYAVALACEASRLAFRSGVRGALNRPGSIAARKAGYRAAAATYPPPPPPMDETPPASGSASDTRRLVYRNPCDPCEGGACLIPDCR